jgi:transposase
MSRESRGKVLSAKTPAVANKAARACRLAALAAGRTQTAIGGFYRRLKARIGGPKAITATAQKMEEQGVAAYEEAYRERAIKQLKRRAHGFGFDLVAAAD